jgi:hypothetical protein
MRATIGRVAVVVVSSISVSGCTSGPSWSSLAWWHKKPDTTAVAEAPKFNPGAPALPSANQNPNNSLANLSRPAATMAAAGPNPAAPAVSYGTPAAYQNTVYPTTPYQQAKLAPTAGANAANSVGTPGANAWANSGTNPWTSGSQAPAATAGYATTTAMTPSGAMPQNYAAGGQSTAMAAAPQYAGPPVASPGQPQAGFYNPTYDGGGSANRYASGAPIPGSAAPANMTTAAAQAPGGSMSGNPMPSASTPNYRTADARSSMASGVSPTSGVESTAANVNNTTVGDRYAGFAGAAQGQTVTNVASPSADRYAAPSPPASAPNTSSGVGDRYAQPSGNVQPAAGAFDQGSTGYNPPNGSASGAATGAGMSSLPARSDSEYRPGGTGNYISPGGSSVQPTSNVQPDSHPQPSASPVSYQSSDASGASPGVVHALHTSPVTGNEVYGSYQGGSSPVTRPSGTSASFSSSNSEPAYGAPNPVAATPALLQSSSN